MTLGDSHDRSPELSGIGGWLGFLCFSLMYLSPAGVLINLAINWRMLTAGAGPVIGQLLSIGLAGFGVFVAIRLNQIHPGAVRLAKMYFITITVLDLISALVIITIPGNAQHALAIFSGLAGSGAWLAYLFRSKRVQNTYAPAAAEKVSDVFA